MTWRLAGFLLLSVLLGACGTAPLRQGTPEAAYQERNSQLLALADWDFVGKLSMDDGRDGGSGRLHWRTRGSSTLLNFRGALGRGAWRLSTRPGEALLEKADGSSARAATVDQLIQQEMGWRIPVNSLRWWVLGVAAPGDPDALELGDAGLLTRLVQDGWVIEYERYQQADGLRMPRRMVAVSGHYRVKLAVSRWTMNAGAAPDA